MVIIDLNWLEGSGVGFDATGDLDTVEGAEAYGSYLALRLAEETTTPSSWSATDVAELKQNTTDLLRRLQRQGYVGEFLPPTVERVDDETLHLSVTVDGTVTAVPLNEL